MARKNKLRDALVIQLQKMYHAQMTANVDHWRNHVIVVFLILCGLRRGMCQPVYLNLY